MGQLPAGNGRGGDGISALLLDGVVAGWTIVVLLAVFSLARSTCSVSYKDVLGKTVSKATPGTATGTAGSLAAGMAVVLAVFVSMSLFAVFTALSPREVQQDDDG